MHSQSNYSDSSFRNGYRARGSVSLTAEEELQLAALAREAEKSARDLLEELPAARRVLQRRGDRGTEMERLQAALAACETEGNPQLKKIAFLLDEAERHHWKLAMSATFLLRREAGRLSTPLMDREEMVQYGYIGLLEAARRFDPERKLRFNTYARWWVRAQMQRALESGGRLVRMPGSAVEDLRRLHTAARELRAMGEPADLATVAQAAGVSRRRARFLLRQGDIVSLEETAEDDLPMQERLADETPRGNCEDQMIETQLMERVGEAFDKILDDRERAILTRHYGLDGSTPSSLTTIGRTMGFSRERIRQFEVLAFQQIRAVL